jgi:signal transduction histidine kinase
MGQLAAGIAHEVNNPLGVVLLYAHLLLEQCPPESSLHNDVIMIVEQADRCKKIVSGLLNFARKNKAALQRVDIYALLHNTFKNLVIPDNINFHFDSTAKSHWIHVDPDQFLQIMTNLIANAIEAMPEGGKLVITIEDKENEVTLKVRDTGIGIPEKHLESIFEPFFTTKQIGKGTGLGLAITYGIIKIHKGQILVESNADKTRGPTGTIFTIKLPRQEILEAF